MIPVVKELAAQGVTVSIDTMHAEVARAAVENGAAIVNDVSGGRRPGDGQGGGRGRGALDPDALAVGVGRRPAPGCRATAMSSREVRAELLGAVDAAVAAGCTPTS